jgi:DNA-binding NarL/FixJ family response regulator
MQGMHTAQARFDANAARVDGPAAAAAGILLVDDHELVRLGFRALVQSQNAAAPPGAALAVFEARTLAEALSLYAAHEADIGVVVLDLSLPDSAGLDALMGFRQRVPRAAVVVLSGSDDAATVRHALALGALAFFAKSGDLGEMVGFVHACVLRGAQPGFVPTIPTTSAAPPLGAGPAAEFTRAAAPALSTRQLQILQWLLEGRSNREIGQLAHLSEGTVKNHVSTLLLTFCVRSRAQLISKLRA